MNDENNISDKEFNEDDLYREQIIIVDPKQTPIRIDKFILSKVMRVSRHRIQNAIKDGAVTVDGKAIKSNHKVKPGQKIKMLIPQHPDATDGVQAENIPLNIVFEDDHLMVIHKPPGLVVHPGVGNHSGTLVNGILYHLQNHDVPVLAGNDPDRAGLVHRLDKDTSGLLVVAKTDHAMTHLAKQFFDHTVNRTYNAIVWGSPEETASTIEGDIGRHPRQRKMNTVLDEGAGGKHAITHFKVLEDLYYVSLIECKLETGRTHQIRVHMKHIGHPVFSDETYGGNQIRKGTVFTKYRKFVEKCFELLPRQALHARTLGFVHPETGEEMTFEAPLPEDMQFVLDRWRNYLASRKTLE